MAKRPKKKPIGVSDQLREAVEASGLSRYQICKLAEVDQAAMSRFMAGKGLTTESIDRLCDVLKLRLVQEPAAKQKGE